MAGCCPGVPAPAILNGAYSEAGGPESDIRPGESVECYMARGGNSTGKHDDATENVLNKIENSSIPVSQSPLRFENIQFTLTAGSTRVPTSWTWVNDGGEPLSTLGVSLSSTGLLNGTISNGAIKKVFKVLVTASDGTGTIDTRGFTFAPDVSSEGSEIRLKSPLPGAIVNSKFGPRMHPIYHVMKPHTGIDMKYENGSVKDVVAAADGEVTLAGGNPSTGYGLRVWIKHSVNGAVICSTTYNHLAKVYVREGQKVMCGQAIGLEGSTGASTGNHLHFEVKLPDGKFIDPEPLINGSLKVAGKTLPTGDADTSTLQTKNSTASLNKTEVSARSTSCSIFGPGYKPTDPPETTDAVPPGADPFEAAWFFTMTQEVGPSWTTTSPTDPDIIAGLIDTAERRKKCGYVNVPNYPGGETKFGIAQNSNPTLNVKMCTYEQAKTVGYNNYWKGSPISCNTQPPYLAVMLFDMNYLHGGGNARAIWNAAVAAGMSTAGGTKEEQLTACQVLLSQRLSFINRIANPEYTRGWTNRANNTFSYIKGLTL